MTATGRKRPLARVVCQRRLSRDENVLAICQSRFNEAELLAKFEERGLSVARCHWHGPEERNAEACCRKPSSSGCKRGKRDDGVEHRGSKTTLHVLKVITEGGLRCKKHSHATGLELGF